MKKRFAFIGAMMLSCITGSYAAALPASLIVNESKATITVKGTVIDSNGEPIAGATIIIPGTTRGTVTDADGHFTIAATAGQTLQASFLGYKTTTAKAGATVKITLADDNALLDEVVVVGYGSQKKANLTGAVSNVDIDKTMNGRPEQDVAKALQGAVPGLTVLSNNGDLDATPSLSIRGLGTLSNGQNSSPLIIVDGVPVDDLTMVNGSDIASISVLKDAASSAIYGSRAAFGVILITTKEAQKGDKVHVKYSGQFAWDSATYLPDYPSVSKQLEAAIIAKKREGVDGELFGMYFTELLPYAQKWEQQNSGKLGHDVMRPYVDDSNVGDYRFQGKKFLYYGDWDIKNIYYNDAAPSMRHDVSITGSSQHSSYYLNFGYDNKQDVIKINPGKRNRYTITANLKTDITDWLTFGTRINWSRRHFSTADPWGNTFQYLWRWGSYFIPNGIYEDADGNQYNYRVYAMQDECNRKVIVHDQLRLNAYAVAHITKDLTLNADYTFQVDNFNYKASNRGIYGMNWSGVAPQWIVAQSNSDATRWNTKRNRWTANAYINWNHTFAKAHTVNVMAGINGENYKSDYFYARRKELYNEEYPELNLAYGDLTKATITSNTGDRASAGYFGRINYDYKGIYLAEFNGRYDGSSRFPEGDRWAFFPSFSLGYRFSEEPYFKDAKEYVSNGKLRFSYGEVGNEAVGDNMFISTITPYQMKWLDGKTKLNGFYAPTWVSSSLTWERIHTTDIGLDLGFLDNELTATFDWYQRTTKDMLAPGVALPSAVGAAAPYTNGGELRSRGWELSLAWRKQFNKDLGLYANFSIGDAKVKVTKWNNSDEIIGHTNSTAYAYAGETWGDIWGFETDRYFTESDFDGKDASGKWIYKKGVADQTGIQTGNFVYGPGDIKYKDLDGDGKIDGGKGTLKDHGDLKVIGNTLPRYEYSFHLGGTYKGFDLDLFFQGVGKRDVWTISAFNFPVIDSNCALYSHQTKYNVYDPDNGVVNISESNDYPCLYSGSNLAAGNVPALAADKGCNNYYPQSKYLVDMSYLRLKNVTLGYTLPKYLTRKAYIENLRFYVSVQNPCLLHKGSGDLPIDPEVNTGQGIAYGGWGRTIPVSKSWAVGLQLTF